eukprot:1148882-Pelagomonas_calceolata.AAC.2
MRDEPYLALLRALTQETPKSNVINAVHLPHNGQRAEGDLWVIPEGVVDFFVGKLRGWVARFRNGSGIMGNRLHGIVELLPAIVIVARGISRAELVLVVHVCFELVRQVGPHAHGMGQNVPKELP